MKHKGLLAAACGLSAAACSAVLADGFRYVFCRNYTALTGRLLDSKNHEAEYYRRNSELKRYMRSRPGTEHSITNADGKLLRGTYYTAGAEPSRAVVFLIHGYRSNHIAACAPFYDYYMSRGIDIFACDHAAHGESEGEMIGFGVTEARDCLAWLDYLTELRGSDIKVILHGFSMGGSVVMLMSDCCPDCVRLIVEDSGFSSAYELLGEELGPLLTPYTTVNRLITGTDIRDSDVRPHLARTTKPIIFVHGREDRFVPFKMAPELYMVCASPDKDRLYVSGAKHIESIFTTPAEYKALLDEKIRAYLTD